MVSSAGSRYLEAVEPRVSSVINLSGHNVDPLERIVSVWTGGGLQEVPAGRIGPPGVTLGPDTPGFVDGQGNVEISRVFEAGCPLGWMLSIRLTQGEQLVGGGESFTGLDLRGRKRVLVNRETHGASGADLAYLNVPFFWSSAGWGLFLDTGAPVLADIGATESGTARFVVLSREVTVSLMKGDGQALLRQYSDAAGKAGDWPDWAFGTWMSRATYMSAAEIHRVLDSLQAADCPVDVVHVDAWMTGNVFREFTCNWTVDRSRFPQGWTDSIRRRGVRTSLWLNPYVLAGSDLAFGLFKSGLLLKNQNGGPAVTSDQDNRYLVDFINPAAVTWWQDQIRRLLKEEHPDALKLDFGEEVPLDAVCHDGRRGIEIRNSYARLYQQATADAIPDDQRPVPFFCRSGSAGSQSWPCHWVGDTPSSWQAMRGALSACLSLSLSGFAMVTHDAGGFHTPGTGEIPAILLDGGHAEFTADVEPELYTRWAQWAAFSPVTRFHGLGLREPVFYPEPWRCAVIRALKVRRQIVPALQRALAQARSTGVPLMRPPFLTHPHAPEARSAECQYMLGSDLLVAPVLEPGGHARVWFPPGEWVALLGAKEPERSGWQDVACKPDEFPVYARRGTLLDP